MRPVTSDSPFRKEIAGGGVLIDKGADVLDSLLYWLGEFLEVEYYDDAEGGAEANCLLNILLKNGSCGVVELSHTRRLRNTAIIRGERGVLEIALDRSHLKLFVPKHPYVLDGSVTNLEHPNRGHLRSELALSQVEEFTGPVT